MYEDFRYGVDRLTVGIALDLADGRRRGVLCRQAREQVLACQAHVEQIVHSHQTVYGVTTGFGPLCTTKISEADTQRLQHNLLQSHSVGVGNLVPPRISKLMLIAKVHALAQGYSGIRLQTLERICWLIDHDLLPAVPEKGSVGASGDLAPLSHLFLPLIGLGSLHEGGKLRPAQEVLSERGLQPLALGPKEGLALINGTQFILAFALQGLERMHNALQTADVIGALSLEALMGSARPFDERLHNLRPFEGCQLVAGRLRALLQGSEILQAHADCERVQDPYSLRCMPQVHGASRNAWQHLRQLAEVELNSVTDNPIVFSAEDTISGGNFHGQPMAMPLDYATLAASELGNISDRRSYLLIEGRFGLPKLLIQDSGLNSGFMIPQYTSAALVTENKTLCFPASADSVPTSLGQEDHVSMGSISGRKLSQVIDNLEYILAVEALYAAQALDFRAPLRTSPALQRVHECIRTHVPHADQDRIFAHDLETLKRLVAEGALAQAPHTSAQTLDELEHATYRLS